MEVFHLFFVAENHLFLKLNGTGMGSSGFQRFCNREQEETEEECEQVFEIKQQLIAWLRFGGHCKSGDLDIIPNKLDELISDFCCSWNKIYAASNH